MKLFFLMTTLCLFNLPAFGSCFISVKGGGPTYSVTIWKHTEGLTDSVTVKDYDAKDFEQISYLLEDKKKATFIFNQGVFTSMRFDEGSTKRWAALSPAEKDMIFFIQSRFDLTERTNERQPKNSEH
jgi:hypothetical protein